MTHLVKEEQTLTRTQETEQQYARVVKRLHLEALEAVEQGTVDPAAVPAMRVVMAFLAREADWSVATVRLYRAALRWHLQNEDTEDARCAITLLDDRENDPASPHRIYLQQIRRARKITSPRGSQQKARSVTHAQLKNLLRELQASRSKWANATIEWYVAGMLTGVRPAEWRHAQRTCDHGMPALQVRNAKSTNFRRSDIERTVPLGELSGWQLALVSRHLARIQGYEVRASYHVLYEACRQLIRDVADRVFPKQVLHPTLYTGCDMAGPQAKSVLERAGGAALLGYTCPDIGVGEEARRWPMHSSDEVLL